MSDINGDGSSRCSFIISIMNFVVVATTAHTSAIPIQYGYCTVVLYDIGPLSTSRNSAELDTFDRQRAAGAFTEILQLEVLFLRDPRRSELHDDVL